MLDQDKYKSKTIKIRNTATQQDSMSVYELARWMSLIEAVDIISTKCDEIGVSEKSTSWVKPIAIKKYVDERTEGMLFELTNQGQL